MENIEVIKCGTQVKPKLLKTEAIITAVNIRFQRATYELSYFNNSDYKTIWMDASEFDYVKQADKINIGFKM